MISPLYTELLNQPSKEQLEAHRNLVKQAEAWVGSTFFGTLLKQMRQSPFRSEKFDGGRGGEAFGAMYDQYLAGRMARGVGGKLSDAIVRKVEGKRAYDAATKLERRLQQRHVATSGTN